jgi:ATP-dependent DNA helicase RecG
VINAIVHRDYASSSDSIVKIFNDRIEVFNPGGLQPGLTVEKLLAGEYLSRIRNRKIADMFKEAGLIEKYGSGIRRVLQEFESVGLPIPTFEEIGEGFRVTAYSSAMAKETPQVTPQVERLLAACLSPQSRAELQRKLGLSDKKHFWAAYLNPSLKAGLIELTNPEKPRSRLQKYRLTGKGRRVLEQTTSRQT